MGGKPGKAIKLGPRFERAFLFAKEKHAGQVRKASTVPYIAHLMGVASLALEYGGDEDIAIAALLHDVVEDCGGEAQSGDDVVVHLRDLAEPFGGKPETTANHLGGDLAEALLDDVARMFEICCEGERVGATHCQKSVRRLGSG